MRWTEAAIAAALEGRFYGLDGKCKHEEREKEQRAAKEAAKAVRMLRVEQVQQVQHVVSTHGSHTSAAIIAAVAHTHGIAAADIVSKSRRRHIIHARQHACALMRQLTGMSTQDIADAVNIIDHSTVVYTVKTWIHRGKAYANEDRIARQMLGVNQ